MIVLRKQRKRVKGNKQYEEAYKAGVRLWRGAYGDRLVDQVRDHLREREWRRALGGTLVLVRHYPQGILLLDERRMERRRLPRRLEARREELEAHERRLGELEASEESGSALAREREEVLVLRKRVGRLERRMQELDRRGWFLRSGKTRRVFRRLVGASAKALRTGGKRSRRT